MQYMFGIQSVNIFSRNNIDFLFQSWYKKSNFTTVLSECQLNQGNTLESHPSINFFNKSNTLQLKYLSQFVYPKFIIITFEPYTYI
jgi:hypothetical protein